MRISSLPRCLAVVVTGLGLAVLVATPASAHITVASPDAEPGGFGMLVFRVPNESDTASTTQLTVKLPADTPFAVVRTTPTPGWSVEARPVTLPEPVQVHGATLTEAVTSVTWTADKGHSLEPGQFGEFELSVGTFPEDVESMSFPTTQTYSDGEVERWNQPVEPGTSEADEPEHPAPMLTLSPVQPAEANLAGVSSTPAGGGDGVARGLAVGAVLLGAASLVAARRSRRT